MKAERKANNIPVSAPDSASVRWEMFRRKYRFLELASIPGDNLSFLFAGNPLAELSLSSYRTVQKFLSCDDYRKAADNIFDLLEKHTATFDSSGWVRRAIADIFLSHKSSAEQLLTKYWAFREKQVPTKKAAAIDAILEIGEEHNAHRLIATSWFKKDHSRKFDGTCPIENFAAASKIRYKQRPEPRNDCPCLSDQAIDAIVEEVYAAEPSLPPHAIKDRAMARFAGVSWTTLVRARAEHRKRVKAKRNAQNLINSGLRRCVSAAVVKPSLEAREKQTDLVNYLLRGSGNANRARADSPLARAIVLARSGLKKKRNS